MEENHIETTQQVQAIVKEKQPMWAQIISIVLHPFFMAIYGVALLFVYTDFKYIFANQFSNFIIRVAFFSCIIPSVSMYFMKGAGYISDYSLTKKEERLLPFFISFFAYSLLFYHFYKAGLYTWFLSVLLVPLILLIVCAIINRWWKISTHMAGIGGLLGTVFSVSYNIKQQNPYELFIILIILVGLLGVARLVLKKHTPTQVYVGFLVGLAVSYITVYMLWYYPIVWTLIR